MLGWFMIADSTPSVRELLIWTSSPFSAARIDEEFEGIDREFEPGVDMREDSATAARGTYL